MSGTGALPGAVLRVYRTASTTGGTGPRDVIAYAGQATADGSGNWTLNCPSAGCDVGLPGAGQVTANQTATSGDSSEMADPKSYTDLEPETTITSGPPDGAITNTTPQFVFDATPASRAFSVDTTAPDTQIDSGPAAGSTTGDSTPSFGFSATEAGSSFECRIDGGDFRACIGPGSAHTPAALGNGPHTFEVRSTDGVGNVDASAATRDFTVDADPPETTIDKQPKRKTTKRKAKFTFTSDEPGSTFECKLDKGEFEPCGANAKFKVKAKKHTLEVRATDAAGNTDPTPASVKWKVKKPK